MIGLWHRRRTSGEIKRTHARTDAVIDDIAARAWDEGHACTGSVPCDKNPYRDHPYAADDTVRQAYLDGYLDGKDGAPHDPLYATDEARGECTDEVCGGECGGAVGPGDYPVWDCTCGLPVSHEGECR
jgi:hypothetical protein